MSNDASSFVSWTLSKILAQILSRVAFQWLKFANTGKRVSYREIGMNTFTVDSAVSIVDATVRQIIILRHKIISSFRTKFCTIPIAKNSMPIWIRDTIRERVEPLFLYLIRNHFPFIPNIGYIRLHHVGRIIFISNVLFYTLSALLSNIYLRTDIRLSAICRDKTYRIANVNLIDRLRYRKCSKNSLMNSWNFFAEIA